MRISDWSSDVCSSDKQTRLAFKQIDVSQDVVNKAYKDCCAIGSCCKFNRLMLDYHPINAYKLDRKSVAEGQSVSVRVDLGGRRFIKKNKLSKEYYQTQIPELMTKPNHNIRI